MELNEALELMEEGKYEKAAQWFKSQSTRNPSDPELSYHLASCLDAQGLEREAAPEYEQAMANGLSGKMLEEAYVQLGSTYRTLGEYEKARDVLEKGRSLFPENRAMDVFYAMVLHNLGSHSRAMELLLKCLADTSTSTDVEFYKKAIAFYASRIDQVWE
ncbi:tetratricopeptide repeat protein [Alteribacter natronophilus]|uniref:tetratricopeptide repeat protein n=1 Tax=Alteribacter natronophilus TaxID=2583810 RepID=UPI00110E7F09|nr:tetratricopeptide repeat protein [Alteribacter natronophilus]TMW72851.1 tetratricopeptide repeat protein [Alteribacter natronophilus]